MDIRSAFSRSLSLKLCMTIGCATCSVLTLTSWVSYQTSRTALESQTNTQAMKQAQATAQQLDSFIAGVAVLPRSLAARQKAVGPNPDPGIYSFMANLLHDTPVEQTYDLYFAFEGKKAKDKDSMPWITRKSWPKGTVVSYDFHDPKQEWYHGAKTTGKMYVTEPYFDDGGANIPMLSVTQPGFDTQGRFIGVAGVDLALDEVQKIVGASHLLDPKSIAPSLHPEYSYLASGSGMLIVHPHADLLPHKGFDGAKIDALPDGKSAMAKRLCRKVILVLTA